MSVANNVAILCCVCCLFRIGVFTLADFWILQQDREVLQTSGASPQFYVVLQARLQETFTRFAAIHANSIKMDTTDTGTLAARLAALAESKQSPAAAVDSQHTLDDRLNALKTSLSSSAAHVCVAQPLGPLTPAVLHEAKLDRETKQRRELKGQRYVPIGPHELVDGVKIGAAIALGCCRSRKCLSFWNVEAILLYREPESQRSHRERLAKLLEYIIHSEKLSRGYVQYAVEVRSFDGNLLR